MGCCPLSKKNTHLNTILFRTSLPQKLPVSHPTFLIGPYHLHDLTTFVDEELTFIHPDDVDLYNTWDSRAFELQVANHELLGHGSGKLFQEDADGKKNFDPEKVCSSATCPRLLLRSTHLGYQPADREAHVSPSDGCRHICSLDQNIQNLLVQAGTNSWLSIGRGVIFNGRV